MRLQEYSYYEFVDSSIQIIEQMNNKFTDEEIQNKFIKWKESTLKLLKVSYKKTLRNSKILAVSLIVDKFEELCTVDDDLDLIHIKHKVCYNSIKISDLHLESVIPKNPNKFISERMDKTHSF